MVSQSKWIIYLFIWELYTTLCCFGQYTHSYMSIQYRLTNKGIVKKVSDTSETIEMSELEKY